MARKVPDQAKENEAHHRRIERHVEGIDGAYQKAVAEAVKLAALVDFAAGIGGFFKWADYPQIKGRLDDIAHAFAKEIKRVIVCGVSAEWGEANSKNDRLVKAVIGEKAFAVKETGERGIPKSYKPYFNNNADALRSFIGRKQRELGLSQRVWTLTTQFKNDLELAISVGLSEGRSADEVSLDVRKYLKEPDRLFRRVRDDYGQLGLSRNAKAYHPGQGVYRSSYKNAQRLARTEINTAYRKADSERWAQLDFVVGVEIRRSAAGYDCSVCGSLTGKYPKAFVWTGWHPSCRCYGIPVLMTDAEFWGADRSAASTNGVRDVPSGFREWVDSKQAMIIKAHERGTLPYFLRDNSKFVNAKK